MGELTWQGAGMGKRQKVFNQHRSELCSGFPNAELLKGREGLLVVAALELGCGNSPSVL